MADKDNDEEKFEDDEDFGLPELHYEELDDDASGDEDDKPKEPEETPDPFSDQGDSDSTEGSFYEEESFDEFKEEDSTSSSGSVFDSDDTPEPSAFEDSSEPSAFGDDSYTQPSEPEPYTAYYNEESSKKAKSNFTKIVIIGTLLFASIAIVFVFFIGDGDLFSSKEEAPPPPPPEPFVDTTAVDSSAFQNVPVKPIKPEPKQLAPGTITTLEQRTGKSYVVIGSFFDGDLAMDYANVLAKNGNSPQIIPPFRDYRFYRVAIAEFNTFRDAEAQAPAYAEQFGREAWPLKY